MGRRNVKRVEEDGKLEGGGGETLAEYIFCGSPEKCIWEREIWGKEIVVR